MLNLSWELGKINKGMGICCFYEEAITISKYIDIELRIEIVKELNEEGIEGYCEEDPNFDELKLMDSDIIETEDIEYVLYVYIDKREIKSLSCRYNHDDIVVAMSKAESIRDDILKDIIKCTEQNII